MTNYLRKNTYTLILDVMTCSSILKCRKKWDRVQTFYHAIAKLGKNHEFPNTMRMEKIQQAISGQAE